LNFNFYNAINDAVIETDIASSGEAMSRTRNSVLWRTKIDPESGWKQFFCAWILGFMLAAALLSSFSSLAAGSAHPKTPSSASADCDKKPPFSEGWPKGFNHWMGPGGWNEGAARWPDPLEATKKRLEDAKKCNNTAGKDSDFIYSKASDLMDRAKQERGFASDRLLFAANALLNAGDFISLSRKSNKALLDKDIWGIFSRNLQSRYFRVQQADFFAQLSGDKNSEQYIKLVRSLYQQAWGAYDARDYIKAQHLADASESIVIALESIAQSAIPIPKPPFFPK
jgi:hypothetical protein